MFLPSTAKFRLKIVIKNIAPIISTMKKIPPFFCILVSLLFLGTPSLLQAANVDPIVLHALPPAEISLPQQQLGKLVFAVDLIRHGDRTPIDEISTVQYTWPEGLGQLTPKGMKQEFALGKHLRELYITQSHLLSERYIPGSLYARSTDSDRTIMSADAFLAGLYENSGPKGLAGYQPIPVHNRPRPQEDLLLPDNNFAFNFDALLQSTVFPTQQWQEKEEALKANFPRWSEAIGKPINNLYDLKPLSDTLYVNQLYHVSKPPLLSDADVNTIIEAGTWGWCTIFKNKTIAQASGANLLADIVTNLETATQPNPTLKYILYAAHDSTILAQLSILGAPLEVMPPYASDLNIELFDQGSGNYIVQVRFNDQPVTLSCSGSSTCTLAQLQALSRETSIQLNKIAQPAY